MTLSKLLKIVPASCVKKIVEFASSNCSDKLPAWLNLALICKKLEVGFGPIVICVPNTVGPKSLISVTILVIGCNTPVFKWYPEAMKLAIEIDSPKLHSMEEEYPPPLLITKGVIDWPLVFVEKKILPKVITKFEKYFIKIV